MPIPIDHSAFFNSGAVASNPAAVPAATSLAPVPVLRSFTPNAPDLHSGVVIPPAGKDCQFTLTFRLDRNLLTAQPKAMAWPQSHYFGPPALLHGGYIADWPDLLGTTQLGALFLPAGMVLVFFSDPTRWAPILCLSGACEDVPARLAATPWGAAGPKSALLLDRRAGNHAHGLLCDAQMQHGMPIEANLWHQSSDFLGLNPAQSLYLDLPAQHQASLLPKLFPAGAPPAMASLAGSLQGPVKLADRADSLGSFAILPQGKSLRRDSVNPAQLSAMALLDITNFPVVQLDPAPQQPALGPARYTLLGQPVWPDRWHRLNLILSGATMRVFLDSKLVGTLQQTIDTGTSSYPYRLPRLQGSIAQLEVRAVAQGATRVDDLSTAPNAAVLSVAPAPVLLALQTVSAQGSAGGNWAWCDALANSVLTPLPREEAGLAHIPVPLGQSPMSLGMSSTILRQNGDNLSAQGQLNKALSDKAQNNTQILAARQSALNTARSAAKGSGGLWRLAAGTLRLGDTAFPGTGKAQLDLASRYPQMNLKLAKGAAAGSSRGHEPCGFATAVLSNPPMVFVLGGSLHGQLFGRSVNMPPFNPSAIDHLGVVFDDVHKMVYCRSPGRTEICAFDADLTSGSFLTQGTGHDNGIAFDIAGPQLLALATKNDRSRTALVYNNERTFHVCELISDEGPAGDARMRAQHLPWQMPLATSEPFPSALAAVYNTDSTIPTALWTEPLRGGFTVAPSERRYSDCRPPADGTAGLAIDSPSQRVFWLGSPASVNLPQLPPSGLLVNFDPPETELRGQPPLPINKDNPDTSGDAQQSTNFMHSCLDNAVRIDSFAPLRMDGITPPYLAMQPARQASAHRSANQRPRLFFPGGDARMQIGDFAIASTGLLLVEFGLVFGQLGRFLTLGLNAQGQPLLEFVFDIDTTPVLIIRSRSADGTLFTASTPIAWDPARANHVMIQLRTHDAPYAPYVTVDGHHAASTGKVALGAGAMLYNALGYQPDQGDTAFSGELVMFRLGAASETVMPQPQNCANALQAEKPAPQFAQQVQRGLVFADLAPYDWPAGLDMVMVGSLDGKDPALPMCPAQGSLGFAIAGGANSLRAATAADLKAAHESHAQAMSLTKDAIHALQKAQDSQVADMSADHDTKMQALDAQRKLSADLVASAKQSTAPDYATAANLRQASVEMLTKPS